MTVAYEPGDLVTVRSEEQVSIIVAPTTRPPDCEFPAGTPDVTVCCVPIALIRTPAGDEDGVLRWVEVADLTRAEAESAAPQPVRSASGPLAYYSGPSGFVPSHSRAPGPVEGSR